MSFKLQDTNHDQWILKYEWYKPTKYMQYIVTYANIIYQNFINQDKDNKITEPNDAKLELNKWINIMFVSNYVNEAINDENYLEIVDDLMLAIDEYIQKGDSLLNQNGAGRSPRKDI
jgi:hypothetical protein